MKPTILLTIKYFTIGILATLWLSSRCNVRAPLKEIPTIVKKEIIPQKKEVVPEIESPPQTISSRIDAYYQKLRDSPTAVNPFNTPLTPDQDLLSVVPLHKSLLFEKLNSSSALSSEEQTIQSQSSPALWELIDPKDGSKIYLCGTMHYLSDYHDSTILDRALKALELSDYFTGEGYGGRLEQIVHKSLLKASNNIEKIFRSNNIDSHNPLKKLFLALVGSKANFVTDTKSGLKTFAGKETQAIISQVNRKNIVAIYKKAHSLLKEIDGFYRQITIATNPNHLLDVKLTHPECKNSISIDKVLLTRALSLGKCQSNTDFLESNAKTALKYNNKEEIKKLEKKIEVNLYFDLLAYAALSVISTSKLKKLRQQSANLEKHYLQESVTYSPIGHHERVLRHAWMTVNILKEPKYRGKTLFIAVGQNHLLGPESMRVQLHRIGYTLQRPILTVEDLL